MRYFPSLDIVISVSLGVLSPPYYLAASYTTADILWRSDWDLRTHSSTISSFVWRARVGPQVHEEGLCCLRAAATGSITSTSSVMGAWVQISSCSNIMSSIHEDAFVIAAWHEQETLKRRHKPALAWANHLQPTVTGPLACPDNHPQFHQVTNNVPQSDLAQKPWEGLVWLAPGPLSYHRSTAGILRGLHLSFSAVLCVQCFPFCTYHTSTTCFIHSDIVWSSVILWNSRID